MNRHALALHLAAAAAPPLHRTSRRLGRVLEVLDRRGVARSPRGGPTGGAEAALDPDLRAMLTVRSAARLPIYSGLSPSVARRALDVQARLGELPPPQVPSVDGVLPGATGPLPSRRYRPPGARGTLLWLHGGGFVLGGLESHDGACRRLAVDTGCEVIAVDYRLAPEHPFPAAWDDALAIFDAVRAETSGPLAVGGDSAGGNLAAHIGLERPGRFDAQILLYPATDLTRAAASHQRLGRGYFLDTPLLDWFCEHAIPPVHRADPKASPLFAPIPAGVAPALVVTAGFDPLVDEGNAYAERLEAAGVPVQAWCEARLIHGYLSMTGMSAEADRAVARLAAAIRHTLAAPR